MLRQIMFRLGLDECSVAPGSSGASLVGLRQQQSVKVLELASGIR